MKTKQILTIGISLIMLCGCQQQADTDANDDLSPKEIYLNAIDNVNENYNYVSIDYYSNLYEEKNIIQRHYLIGDCYSEETMIYHGDYSFDYFENDISQNICYSLFRDQSKETYRLNLSGNGLFDDYSTTDSLQQQDLLSTRYFDVNNNGRDFTKEIADDKIIIKYVTGHSMNELTIQDDLPVSLKSYDNDTKDENKYDISVFTFKTIEKSMVDERIQKYQECDNQDEKTIMKILDVSYQNLKNK